jgi:hypothetical protein
MGAIWQDLRFALRGIARKPLLALAVLLALVAGIGLNAAVFALLNDFWFRAPVERDPGGFIQAVPSYSGWFETENQFHGFTVNDYEAIRAYNLYRGRLTAYQEIYQAAQPTITALTVSSLCLRT